MSTQGTNPSDSNPKPVPQKPAEVLPTNFRIYKPSTRTTKLPEPALGELTPTAAEIQAAQATLAARNQALNNAPLQTRATREAELKVKRDRWPETKIRIKFTDGTQLEKIFLSSSKIKPVYAFVRSCLKDDVKPIKFVLYQPPKRELKVSDLKVRDLSLAELQLAPSSLLLIKFEDDHLNHTNIPAPLAETVLVQSIDLPSPPAEPEVLQPSATSSSSSSFKANMQSYGEVKIPKWMRIGQRK